MGDLGTDPARRTPGSAEHCIERVRDALPLAEASRVEEPSERIRAAWFRDVRVRGTRVLWELDRSTGGAGDQPARRA